MSLSDASLRALASCEEQYPYLAAALDSLYVVERPNLPVLAACSSQGVIYLRSPLDLPRDQAGGLVAHEIWHWLSGHFTRRGDRDAKAWNLATDAEINDDMIALPPDGIYPRELDMADGLLAEEYYRSDKIGRITIPADMHSGSAADGSPRVWEDHPEAISEIHREDIRVAVAEAIRGLAVPGGCRRWSEEVLKKRVPPFSVRFRAACRSAGAIPVEPEPCWAVPARRQHSQVLCPGKRMDVRSVVVLLDTSGSMSPVMAGALGAIHSLASRFGSVSWACGDTSVTSRGHHIRYLQDDLQGGGGTDMAACLTTLDKEACHALIIVVTDGETGWPSQPLRTPVVAVMTDKSNASHCPLPHVCLGD